MKLKINGRHVRWLASIAIDILELIATYWPRSHEEEFDNDYYNHNRYD